MKFEVCSRSIKDSALVRKRRTELISIVQRWLEWRGRLISGRVKCEYTSWGMIQWINRIRGRHCRMTRDNRTETNEIPFDNWVPDARNTPGHPECRYEDYPNRRWWYASCDCLTVWIESEFGFGVLVWERTFNKDGLMRNLIVDYSRSIVRPLMAAAIRSLCNINRIVR